MGYAKLAPLFLGSYFLHNHMPKFWTRFIKKIRELIHTRFVHIFVQTQNFGAIGKIHVTYFFFSRHPYKSKFPAFLLQFFYKITYISHILLRATFLQTHHLCMWFWDKIAIISDGRWGGYGSPKVGGGGVPCLITENLLK